MRLIPDTVKNLATLIDHFRLVLSDDDFEIFIRVLEREFDSLMEGQWT